MLCACLVQRCQKDHSCVWQKVLHALNSNLKMKNVATICLERLAHQAAKPNNDHQTKKARHQAFA
jgi:hypothetical protein